MGRCLIRLDDSDGAWFLEWSTVVDAPATYGLRYEDACEAWGKDRVDRCADNGTTWMHEPARYGVSEVTGNRAGFEECNLTSLEIVEWFCQKQEPAPVECGSAWLGEGDPRNFGHPDGHLWKPHGPVEP